MYDLAYPDTPTYFVAWDDVGNVGYGITDPDQVTTSGMQYFQSFSDEDSYKAKLLTLGVDLDAIAAAETTQDSPVDDNGGDL